MISLSLAACQPQKPPPAASPSLRTLRPEAQPNMNTDPCAMRLHDICEPLLLYYATYQRLPAKIQDLQAIGGAKIDPTCPVSKKPYVYNPEGLKAPGGKGWIILYDPTPDHNGVRWGISIIEPEADGPLVTKVVAVPPSVFIQPLDK